MSICSSQLQSQLFSKVAAWEIILEKFPWTYMRRTAPPNLTVEVYNRAVYVHLPKSDDARGISTFLSFWDFLDRFMTRCTEKANKVKTFLMRKGRYNETWNTTSFQGVDGNTYKVELTQFGGRCTCMLFLCFGNRVRSELPYCFRLMQQSRFFNGHPICHHIQSAVEHSGFNCISDFTSEITRRRQQDKRPRYKKSS